LARLCQVLCTKFPSIVVPAVLQMLQQVAAASQNPQQLFAKAAVYYAIGLNASEISPKMTELGFPFHKWYGTALQDELSHDQGLPQHKLIRKRAIWLIGKFVPFCTSNELFCTMLSVLMRLLFSENDVVLLLTAIDTLSAMLGLIEKFPGSTAMFQNAAPRLFKRLFEVIRLLGDMDARVEVFSFCSRLVELLTPLSGEVTEEIIRNVEGMFRERGANREDQWPLQCEFVGLLTGLVRAMKNSSLELRGVILPILQYCMQVVHCTIIYACANTRAT